MARARRPRQWDAFIAAIRSLAITAGQTVSVSRDTLHACNARTRVSLSPRLTHRSGWNTSATAPSMWVIRFRKLPSVSAVSRKFSPLFPRGFQVYARPAWFLLVSAVSKIFSRAVTTIDRRANMLSRSKPSWLEDPLYRVQIICCPVLGNLERGKKKNRISTAGYSFRFSCEKREKQSSIKLHIVLNTIVDLMQIYAEIIRLLSCSFWQLSVKVKRSEYKLQFTFIYTCYALSVANSENRNG